MFTVDEVVYTLRFNEKKMDSIEMQTGKALMSEFQKTSGLIPNFLLRAMFTTGLVEEEGNKPVNGQKAIDIFDKVKEENGYKATVLATINKFTEDMGFMFR